MGVELLFGLSILALIVAWALWLFWITRESNAGIIGGAVAVILLAGFVVYVNAERQDVQREDYGQAVRDYIAFVEGAQEEEFERQGAYSEDLPEVSEDLGTYTGGALQDEQDLDPELSLPDEKSYVLTVSVQGETFTVTVKRTAGQVSEERTCEGSSEAGCVDGAWEA
jgi:hypothetical protein